MRLDQSQSDLCEADHMLREPRQYGRLFAALHTDDRLHRLFADAYINRRHLTPLEVHIFDRLEEAALRTVHETRETGHGR